MALTTIIIITVVTGEGIRAKGMPGQERGDETRADGDPCVRLGCWGAVAGIWEFRCQVLVRDQPPFRGREAGWDGRRS